MLYRWAFDIGANSIGWAVFGLSSELKTIKLVDSGVRVFPDGRNPKSRTSNAVARRIARQARRRRDRYLKRRHRFMSQLIECGLMPIDKVDRKALEHLDPYELRVKALDEKIPLYQLGRLLFHLGQRRGFKSSRKDDGDVNEKGKISQGIERLQQVLAEYDCRTVGEFLAKRHTQREGTRIRAKGKGAKSFYDFYVHREMIAQEFDLIWQTQSQYYPEVLTDARKQQLRDTLLFQRKLRPVLPGMCVLDNTRHRSPLALPSIQQFRILQELNNIRVTDTNLHSRALTLEERNTLLDSLSQRKEATFSKIKEKIKIPDSYTFNLESATRTKLKGNSTAALLANNKAFGKSWYQKTLTEQDEIVEELVREADEKVLINTLM
ncbi:type II CRISPR RNA-guided endonuclease Cas9, partial [Zooshikella ganghwensis]|uniref:type II CRISPR RNA-guided endonuclease Cas9 n=1 Tax=Zooshikella ganghwensis TaxID=202772 RepID=UPI0004872376